MSAGKADPIVLRPRPPWPYSPSDDLPQIITTLFVDDDDRVEGVWWSEALGNIGLPWGAAGLMPDQLERIAAWLENWLVTEPEEFTEKGRSSVERMRDDLRRALTRNQQDERRRRQWETKEFDHLL